MFELDGPFLTRKIRLFQRCEMTCIGFCHSHPAFVQSLSEGDLRYARQLMSRPKNRSLRRLFMPIVCDATLFAYVVHADGTVSVPTLILV